MALFLISVYFIGVPIAGYLIRLRFKHVGNVPESEEEEAEIMATVAAWLWPLLFLFTVFVFLPRVLTNGHLLFYVKPPPAASEESRDSGDGDTINEEE